MAQSVYGPMGSGSTGGGGGIDWMKLLSGAGNFAGGPWGKALGILGAGGLGMWGANRFAPSQMDMARQKMRFFQAGLQGVPGLAGMYRNALMQGSGAEQQNLIGASNQFQSGLRRRLSETGLGGSALAGLTGAMGQSMLGRNMANMYQRYSLGSMDMANQATLQGLLASLQGNDDMRNRIMGGVLGTTGDVLNRTLFPRQYERNYG